MHSTVTIPSTILWVSAHPEPRSLNGVLRREAIAYLHQAGHRVLESDLYAMGWNPVLHARDGGHLSGDEPTTFRVSADTRAAFLANTQPPEVAREQVKLRQADVVIVQFPL